MVAVPVRSRSQSPVRCGTDLDRLEANHRETAPDESDAESDGPPGIVSSSSAESRGGSSSDGSGSSYSSDSDDDPGMQDVLTPWGNTPFTLTGTPP